MIPAEHIQLIHDALVELTDLFLGWSLGHAAVSELLPKVGFGMLPAPRDALIILTLSPENPT